MRQKPVEKILPILVMVFLALVTSANAADLHWYSTLEEASSAAIKVNKPMFLDFWADWCAACKVMEKDLYNDQAFASVADRFVLVRINFDKKTALARKYNIEALPTVVFTDSYGGEFIRHRGFLDIKPFVRLMQALPSDVKEFNAFSKILMQDKNNFEALQSMAMHLRDAGLFLASNEYYERALKRNEAKGNSAPREAIMTDLARNSLAVRDGAGAADTLEKCLKEFPKSDHRSDWILDLGHAYLLTDKKDKARKLLDRSYRPKNTETWNGISQMTPLVS
jgi:thioredoxin-related protein